LAFVEMTFDNGLAILTLMDSSKGNRLNGKRLEEIFEAFAQAEQTKDASAILLRSNGKTFCIGMDLDSLVEEDSDLSSRKHAVSLYHRLLLSFWRSPLPVVCCVQGEVKAGGVGLVAASDIAIASSEAAFELSEVLFGLIPANVLPFLALRLSLQKAKYMALTARKLTAEEAKNLNLVDEVYPPDSLEKNLRSVVKRLFRASPRALKELKDYTSKMASLALKNVGSDAQDRLIRLMQDPGTIRGIKALQEGGLPAWFSRSRPEKPLLWGENNER